MSRTQLIRSVSRWSLLMTSSTSWPLRRKRSTFLRTPVRRVARHNSRGCRHFAPLCSHFCCLNSLFDSEEVGVGYRLGATGSRRGRSFNGAALVTQTRPRWRRSRSRKGWTFNSNKALLVRMLRPHDRVVRTKVSGISSATATNGRLTRLRNVGVPALLPSFRHLRETVVVVTASPLLSSSSFPALIFCVLYARNTLLYKDFLGQIKEYFQGI